MEVAMPEHIPGAVDLSSVGKAGDTGRLSIDERLDQLEEFARWCVQNFAALDQQNQHIAGTLVSIIENAKALHEVKDS
jgi:hypothetical protein